jgi:hypothetical protein
MTKPEPHLRIKAPVMPQAAWFSACSICDITHQRLCLCGNHFQHKKHKNQVPFNNNHTKLRYEPWKVENLLH